MVNSELARGAFAITAGASPLAQRAHGLYIGGAGNVTVTGADGVSVTFTAVPAGTHLKIIATHVTAATATNIVGYRL